MDYKILLVIVTTAVISGLVTYFITNVTRRRAIEKLEKRQQDFEKDISEKVRGVSKEYQVLRVSMVFMVTQLGGNPSEMGLM